MVEGVSVRDLKKGPYLFRYIEADDFGEDFTPELREQEERLAALERRLAPVQRWRVERTRWVGSPSRAGPAAPSGAIRVTIPSMALGTAVPGRAARSTVL